MHEPLIKEDEPIKVVETIKSSTEVKQNQKRRQSLYKEYKQGKIVQVENSIKSSDVVIDFEEMPLSPTLKLEKKQESAKKKAKTSSYVADAKGDLIPEHVDR